MLDLPLRVPSELVTVFSRAAAEVWSSKSKPPKSFPVLQTAHHHFSIYACSGIALALCRRDGP